jgi:methyltransferase (TIGR00027 family)
VAVAKRSRTAQGVLAERAILTDLGVLDDPFARGMLSPGMALIYRFARRRPQVVPTLPVTLAGLAARVRWHDERVLEALDDGIRQVAVIGAGYDSRAWRFQHDGVRFFEVDHEATQADKVRRAPSPGPTYVQADLADQSAASSMLASGFDATQPAMFVLEGVTMYLSEEAVRHQLTELSGTSAAGSRLSTDFYPRPQAGTTRDQRQRGCATPGSRGKRRAPQAPCRRNRGNRPRDCVRLGGQRGQWCTQRGEGPRPADFGSAH